MGLRQKIADAATDPMNDPRLSLSDKALAVAIGSQVEQAMLRALRQHQLEQSGIVVGNVSITPGVNPERTAGDLAGGAR